MNDKIKCPEGSEPNPIRKKGQWRCRVTCNEGEYRDEKFECVKNATRKKVSLVKDRSSPSAEPSVKTKSVSVKSPIKSDAGLKEFLVKKEAERMASDATQAARAEVDQTKKPCDEIKRLDAEIKKLSSDKKMNITNCNKERYWDEKNQPKTHLALLKRIYSDKGLSDCDELFSHFPESGERTENLYTKPYIFESLWKIIFLLKLDNKLAPSLVRTFKKSIESGDNIEVYKYLSHEYDGKINSGNAFGVCDLMFTVNKEKNKTDDGNKKNACDVGFVPETGDAYLFTSKYYNKEHGIGNYDYEKIYMETMGKYSPLHIKDDKQKFQIITLINNKDDFLQKLNRRSDKSVKKLINPDDVFGYEELKIVYYPKLIRWLEDNFNKDNIEDEGVWKKAIGSVVNDVNIVDILRIHQEYFVATTLDIIETKKHPKIIWGAVARSGKSYMVGGLIAKLKPKIVILILGAVGETKTQFVDIFEKYTDLKKEYTVWDTQGGPKDEPPLTKGKKIVVIISQDKLRADIKANKPENKLMQKMKEYLKEENKLIFFDEIHQGGSETSQQDKTIGFFYEKANNPELKEPILIMVTATYTKPLLNYYREGFGVDKTVYLINWSYNMIMKMKNFNISMTVPSETPDDSKLLPFPSPDKMDEYKKRMHILNKIIIDNNVKKGKSDELISLEYQIYPELVYLIPTIKKADTELQFDNENPVKMSDSSNINKLWETAGNSLKYPNAIQAYLNYIYSTVYSDLLNNTYNYVANGEGNTHTQLWFLPTNLRGSKGNKIANGPEDDNSIFKTVGREIAKSIVNNEKFRNFNVCVVHALGDKGDKSKLSKDENERIFFKCTDTNLDVKNCIREIEIESKVEPKNSRSLIILTGKRLRLGISLPCVDIAIHMDPIESYDIMYQSMFRVLTERNGKTKGFFVDMIADRSVKFMYNYAIQEKEQTSDKEIRIDKNDIKNALLLFDVNGLKTQLGYVESNLMRDNYESISQKFGIADDGQFRENIEAASIDKTEIDKEMKSLLENILQNESDKKKLVKYLKEAFTKQKKRAAKKQTEPVAPPNLGFAPTSAPAAVPAPAAAVPAPDVPPVLDDATIIDNAIKSIRNTLTLYSLFSPDETTRIDRMLDVKFNDELLRSILECEDDEIIHLCYLGDTGISNKCSELTNQKTELTKQKAELTNQKTELTNQKTELTKQKMDDIQMQIEDIDHQIEEKKQERKKYFDKESPQFTDLFEEQIEEQLKLVKFIYTYNGEHSKKALNKLYGYISNDMKKLKSLLKIEQESFAGTSSEVCPAKFTNVNNDKVLELVRKYLTPKDSERTLFGEVFTPLELVCEMLNHLPVDVWTNKQLKWLDPANGIGNFPIVVYYKLMETLRSVPIKDRSKHIIENMLYMNELNPVNVAVCKKIFKMIDPGAKPNIMTSNFLSEFMITGKDKFFFTGITNFDVIIGNPPYNENGTGKGGGVLWKPFVFKSFDLLNDNGILNLIHPLGWRKPKGEHASAGDVFDRFKHNQIIFVKISDVKIPHFPGVDFYVVQKDKKKDDQYLSENPNEEQSSCKTHVINEFNGIKYDGDLELCNMDFIPNFNNKKTYKKEG